MSHQTAITAFLDLSHFLLFQHYNIYDHLFHGGAMNKVKFKLDVSRHRIVYTHKNGFLPPRKRRYLHHWYTFEEIIRLADYFDVPVPKQIENREK
jgi:hypothetical protein